MIFLYLFPFYLAVGAYLLFRIFHWTLAFAKPLNVLWFKISFGVVFFFCLLSPIFANLLPKCKFTIFIRRLSTYWLGVMCFMVMALTIIDIVRLILKHTRLKDSVLFTPKALVIIGTVTAVLLTAVCTYGLYNARNIKLRTYDIEVAKSCGETKDLKVALVADLHIGYSIGAKHVTNMVEKVNAINPDIVIIAGDIFDNSFDSLDDPDAICKAFKSLKSKYGTYATFGNHDIEEKLLMGFTLGKSSEKTNGKEMIEFLEKSDITLLRDEVALINDEFYIVGRRDAQKPSTKDGSRLSASELTENLDKSKPVIFVDHEPSQLQKVADAGADVDLSGHTHDGQIFPGNILVGMMWENSCGMIKKDNMYSIVTSGVGVFGPYMRVGTDSEICEVNIHFKG